MFHGDMINFDDFKKIDLRVARILEAERVVGSEKLIKLKIEIGEDDSKNPPEKIMKLHGLTPGASSPPSAERNPPKQKTGIHPWSYDRGLLRRRIKQIVAGIGKSYQPEELINKEIAVVVNLEPRQLMGIESQAMLLAAVNGEPVLLVPEKEVPSGSQVK